MKPLLTCLVIALSWSSALSALAQPAASHAAREGVSVTEVRPEALVQSNEKEALSPQPHVPCVAQTVRFPAGSSWQLCVKAVEKYGLIITHAIFKKSPTAIAIRVLSDGRLGEIFVPYHPGQPRFGDISQFSFSPLTLNTVDCPLPRVRLDVGRICREIVDNGVVWKVDTKVRRGREARYWAVLDAANYNYIMEWSFRDDGAIVVRAGSTGPKLGGETDSVGHMHDFTWRLDIDLNGSGGDSAHFTRHTESTAAFSATDSASLITTESGLLWNALQFNTLEITDSVLTNNNGRQTSYGLVPLRMGTARHFESFLNRDFWVTRHSATELLANSLPSYVNGQSTVNTDIVIWYTGSAHHESNMRDEDRQTVPVLWTGFMLVPHNLFEGTPFF